MNWKSISGAVMAILERKFVLPDEREMNLQKPLPPFENRGTKTGHQNLRREKTDFLLLGN